VSVLCERTLALAAHLFFLDELPEVFDLSFRLCGAVSAAALLALGLDLFPVDLDKFPDEIPEMRFRV
jgi:hypothetical protein